MNKLIFLISLFISSLVIQPNYLYAVTDTTQVEDEFTDFTEEATSNDDEFSDFTETSSDEFGDVNQDEFSEFSDDEFSDLSDDEFSSSEECGSCPASGSCGVNKKDKVEFHWTLIILFMTVLAGIFVRFKTTRKLRTLFLVASIFILGFYKQACSVCPLNGIENMILFISGYEVGWRDLIWFIAIIPITYIFGKVWCGWICHLGAIQEFVYLPQKVKILATAKAQKIFRISRYVLLVILIVQLAIMGSKYWCKIDPFLNIFDFKNFFGYLITTNDYDIELYVIITLVLYVLISSIFVYRSFCRTMCPIGLVLGWISRLPGASIIGIKGDCVGCKMCNTSCELDAITRDNKYSTIYNPDCNSCGKCIDSCSQDGMAFVRKGKKYPTVVKCENNCSIGKKA